jgi:hypothetical protein
LELVSSRRNSIVAAADGSVSVIDLPRVSDCSINKLFEVANRLPDNYAIVRGTAEAVRSCASLALGLVEIPILSRPLSARMT